MTHTKQVYVYKTAGATIALNAAKEAYGVDPTKIGLDHLCWSIIHEPDDYETACGVEPGSLVVEALDGKGYAPDVHWMEPSNCLTTYLDEVDPTHRFYAYRPLNGGL